MPISAEKVRELYDRCKANGYIYKSAYTGYYSVVQEAFVQDAKEGDVDPETGQFSKAPLHDEFSDGADGFRYLAVALREKGKPKVTPYRPRFIAPSSGAWMA